MGSPAQSGLSYCLAMKGWVWLFLCGLACSQKENWKNPEATPPPAMVDIHWEDVRRHWEESNTVKEYYLATGGSPIFQMEEGEEHSLHQISYVEDVEYFEYYEDEEPYYEQYDASVDEEGSYLFACGQEGHAQRGEIVRINTITQEYNLNLNWRDMRRHWKKTGEAKTFYLETGGRQRFKRNEKLCLLDSQESFDDCNLENCEDVTGGSMVMQTDGVFHFSRGGKDLCKNGMKARVVVSPPVFEY